VADEIRDDVRLATSLRHHRKLKRLRRRAGAEACWALVCLWMYAGIERWDGELAGLSDADLEEEADWEGAPGALVLALVEVGFLEGEAGSRRLHDWAEHQPFVATRAARIEASRRAANARWDRQRKPRNPHSETPRDDATRMRPACVPDAGVMPQHQHQHHSTDALTSTPPAADSVGCFESGADVPRGTPNPAAAHAIALNRAGVRCTTLNPRLVAFADAGGTVDHLLQVAALDECQGKPAGYVVAIALRELSEPAAAPVPSSRSTTSSVMAGLSALESLKHEPANAHAQLESPRRDPDRPAEALHAAPRRDALP
jgi:hypothetical protein